MVNCSGSSRPAPNVVVDLASGRVRPTGGLGAGGALGTGWALARGTGMAWRISGVSEGLGEATFRGAGDFSVFAAAFVFFFGFGVASLAADFFFGFASGVSFGVAVGVASSSVFFFAFGDSEPDFPLYGQPFGFALGLGDWVGSGVSRGVGFAFGLGAGEASFFVFDFCRAVFAFAAGLGDSSGDGDAVARAFRNCARFSSSVNCAWTNVPTVALSANRIASQNRKRPTVAQRNRARCAINPERFRVRAKKNSRSSRLRCRSGRLCSPRALAFAAKDRVQFAAEKQKE